MPRPIVILHGWSDRSANFTALRNYVATLSGVAPVEINLADYVSMDDEVRFDDLAVAMERAWREAGLPTAPRSTDVIVHSTGGLVVRDWFTRFYKPGKAPVFHLLMLAPANFGSPLAHKGASLIGRVIKGWSSEKRFQTGKRILKGLELASPYAWELAGRDRFARSSYYGKGRILCTVLIGNTGYSGISAVANEDGSDGTVRAASANLNCARLDADFSQDPKNPVLDTLRGSTGRTAFRVLNGDNHSTAAMKDDGPRDPKGRELIARALAVTDAQFEAWCDQCDAETALITAQAEKDKNEEGYGYQNTVVRVVDDAGAFVGDYFLEFYLEDQDDPASVFSEFFHREVIRSVHPHSDNASYRSLMVDCTTLFQRIDKHLECMKVSLSATPELAENGYVGYRTFTDEDIGALSLTHAQLQRVFVPHRTLLIQITLKRERAAEVFRIKSGA